MDMLLLASFLRICVVWLTGEIFKVSQTRIVRSAAFPNRVHALVATHSIDIFAAEPLIQILIFVPSEISVGQVQLVDKQFQKVPITVSKMDAGLLINLDSPTAPWTNFTVLMQEVRISTRNGRIWNYQIYVKWLNEQSFKTIGAATVPTYSDMDLHTKILD